MSRTEIGELLHVSPNTVRTHVQSILHKLKVHSALAAVAIARRAGITGASVAAG
jgi:DNA-binding NarL/FixJ family response regulator